MHCEMIITIKFISTSITSHSSLLGVCVMRTLGIYSLSKFQVCSTVLLPLIITLYIRSPEFIHLATLLWSTFMRLPLLAKKKETTFMSHFWMRCHPTKMLQTDDNKPGLLTQTSDLAGMWTSLFLNHLYVRDSRQGKCFPGGTMVKNSPANARRARETGLIPGLGRFPWRRKWPPTPVFLPGESHGQGSLVGFSPWGRKETDTTEHTQHMLLRGASWASDTRRCTKPHTQQGLELGLVLSRHHFAIRGDFLTKTLAFLLCSANVVFNRPLHEC